MALAIISSPAVMCGTSMIQKCRISRVYTQGDHGGPVASLRVRTPAEMMIMTPTADRNIPLIEPLGAMWCRLMHATTAWPIHGHYQCVTCLRQFPVEWN